MNQLESLKQWTKVVADTGDWREMQRFQPDEATTNPSLIWKLFQKPDYDHYLQEAYGFFKNNHHRNPSLQEFLECVLVTVGKKILDIIPGRVSTEVDARYSFDVESTLTQAHRLHDLYRAYAIPSNRVLMKIAATWEGIKAAEVLEKEGIACNLTLIFSRVQAIACAEAGVTLISPFVGRIFDWYNAHNLLVAGEEDPGVRSVKSIYNYLKQYRYKTEIMGASFRTVEQITALAGCDRLTIAPKLLAQLEANTRPITPQLQAPKVEKSTMPESLVTEKSFRWQLNEDPMATEKLAEGIRLFASDTQKLEKILLHFLEGKQ
ncbi:MAG: transaldolase [Puniceicoccales bacterium]|jgi:transaldolase|nr:transaldolase [Puniceicoccales bacterium]